MGRDGLQALLTGLAARGYTLMGPALRGEAIVHDEIRGASDLPEGLGDEQSQGRYRVRRREDRLLFGFASGPRSWKQLFFPPHLRLYSARRADGGLRYAPARPAPPRYALIGVRSCDLAAIEVQDRTFLAEPHKDPFYEAARREAIIVALNCTECGGTCFCGSMGTGPEVRGRADLVLTELPVEGGSDFLVEARGERGLEALARGRVREASEEDARLAAGLVESCRRSMVKRMPAADRLHDLLKDLEHPRYAEVARRCLSCGNCTLACPTCFCSSLEESGEVGGAPERWRRWDVCFTNDFTYIHGGCLRDTTRTKYRQWLTHKLASWHDQFGTSGCVGCGRCITWCPVGIDITEEAGAILEGRHAEKTPDERLVRA